MEQRITDLEKNGGGGGGASTAAEVHYDNFDTGLLADNVQDAIDEVNDKFIPKFTFENVSTEPLVCRKTQRHQIEKWYNTLHYEQILQIDIPYGASGTYTIPNVIDAPNAIAGFAGGGVVGLKGTAQLWKANDADDPDKGSPLRFVEVNSPALSANGEQITVQVDAHNQSIFADKLDVKVKLDNLQANTKGRIYVRVEFF